MLDGRADSLVQVIERVGDANCHLHSSLRGQFLNSCISLLPEGLGVVLVGQARNLPFLQEKKAAAEQSALFQVFREIWNNVFELEDYLTLNSLGKTSVGWPRITNSRELSLRRLESKSSRLCSKNLEDNRK